MIQDRIRKFVSNSKPYAEKLLADTLKGYVFGCAFGVFTPSRGSLYKSMHENGKNFAKMSAVYSVTEMTLEKVNKNSDTFNNFVAGAMAGAVGSKKGFLPGSAVFGLYSGLSTHFSCDK